MKIAIIEAHNGTGYGYCPVEALLALRHTIEYSDSEQFETPDAAITAFKVANPDIQDAVFVLYRAAVRPYLKSWYPEPIHKTRHRAPRHATQDELQVIARLMENRNNQPYTEVMEFLDNARVAVFDDYMSDGPGYFGRVAVVVWPGGPDLFNVFTLDGFRPEVTA